MVRKVGEAIQGRIFQDCMGNPARDRIWSIHEWLLLEWPSKVNQQRPQL